MRVKVTLPHAVFLRRVSYQSAEAPPVRLGQGAFLALRLADLTLRGGERVAPDAFRYQWAATLRYCDDLAREPGVEGDMVRAIARATQESFDGRPDALLAPLSEYARFLEQEEGPEEALDVLNVLIAVDRDHAPDERVRSGRVDAARLRKLLGRSPATPAAYRRLAGQARKVGDAEVEARAQRALGNCLCAAGRPVDGASHIWRAFSRSALDPFRTSVLLDLGRALLAAGESDAAARALRAVVKRDGAGRLAALARAQLMLQAAGAGDQLAFARLWHDAQPLLEEAPAHVTRSVYAAAASGYERFGNARLARELRLEAADGEQPLVMMQAAYTLDAQAEPRRRSAALLNLIAEVALLDQGRA